MCNNFSIHWQLLCALVSISKPCSWINVLHNWFATWYIARWHTTTCLVNIPWYKYFSSVLHFVTPCYTLANALQRQTPQPAPQLTVIAHSTCCSVALHVPPVNPLCPNVAQNKISTVSNNRLSRRKPEKLDLKSEKIQIKSNLRTELSGAMSSFSNLVITVLGLHLLACL